MNEEKPKSFKMFEGVTTAARRFGYLGLLFFIAGTVIVGLYVVFSAEGDPLLTIGLPLLWLVVVFLRVTSVPGDRELFTFVEVMKWQIAIGAAAAAVIAPIGMDPEGQMDPRFVGPIAIFLVSSGFAALGYALVREAFLQVQDAAAKREREELVRTLGEAVTVAMTKGDAPELERLRGEVARLKLPWWKRRG